MVDLVLSHLKRVLKNIINLLSQVCLVFTDGEANDKNDVPAATQKWAADGVPVFAIGIGSGISRDGLAAIAGADERVLEVDNFAEIGDIAKSLFEKVCKTVGK